MGLWGLGDWGWVLVGCAFGFLKGRWIVSIGNACGMVSGSQVDRGCYGNMNDFIGRVSFGDDVAG